MNPTQTLPSHSNVRLPYRKAQGVGAYSSSTVPRGTLSYILNHNQQPRDLRFSSSRLSLVSTGTENTVRGQFINPDMAISNFHITFDAHGAKYKPGDEMTGKVIMDVWAGLAIKHVEFVITGKGTLRMFQSSSTFIEKPRYEVYIEKKIVLIGSPNPGRGVTLEPGRYVTNFQYTLPDNVPPSVHQNDMGNGYIFDISYMVQARVCDFIHTQGAQPSMLRVIKATRKSFSVLPPQEWHSLPGALEQVSHSDHILLLCGPGKKNPTTVVVSMDRSVYPVGDVVKLTIEVISPGNDIIKDISAELEQQLFFHSDLIKKFRRVILTAFDDGKNRLLNRGGVTMKSTFGLSLPTNIVPSHLPFCKLIDLEYTIKVKVRFSGLGGKIIMRLPVVISPAGDSDRKDGELPLFNKPITQFPFFSKRLFNSSSEYPQSNSASDESTNGALQKSSVNKGNKNKQEDSVTTKYKTALKCCGCCLLCMGVGIVDS